MTPREPSSPLRRVLARHHRSVARAWAIRSSLPAAAASAVAIAAAVALGALLPMGEIGARARLALLLLAVAALLVLAVRRAMRSIRGFDAHLEAIEARFPQVRSWLRNALDFESRPPAHGSPELVTAVSHETARRLEATPIRELVPGLEPRRPALATAAAAAALVGLGLAFPERTGRSWETLWNPALAAPPVRLAVEPGTVRVTPGAALGVRARVWGSVRAPSLLRGKEPAVAAVAEGRGDSGELLWRFDLTQLTREQEYRVRVAHVESPRYRILLAGEPVPVSFEIEYRAPAYSRLPVQRGAATRGDLSALRGTRALVEVTFDRDLEGVSATLPGAAPVAWREQSPRRWRGEIVLDREGEYRLDARAATGQARFRYRLQPLADAPPLLAVRTPAGDLDLPAGQQVPLEILGQDDLGLSELRLHVRKDPAGPWTETTLARFPGEPREAAVTSRWDASSLGLLPGQSAAFRFELLDDNVYSGRGRALSPVFELRFPSLSDLYQEMDRSQGDVQTSLEKVADQARELQKSLDKLARQQNRASAERPSFERSEEVKSALERQRQISERIEEAARDLRETLEKAAERRAFDEELTRKLREMSQIMSQIQSNEFKDALRRMQQALENLDRQALEQSLPDWRRESQEMLSNLERTIELLKQLRQEERLESLSRRAQDLKQQQDRLNQEHAEQERSPEGLRKQEEARALAERQQRAAEESRRLARETREASREQERQSSSAERSEAEQRLEKAAETLEREVAQDQQEASESALRQQPQRGRQKGEQASQKLGEVADQMAEMAESMRQEREGVDLAAVRRAAQDLVALQREAERNLASTGSPAQRADRQTDLAEGTSRVADSLYMMSRRTPFISPKISEALGRAIQSLSSSGKELAGGNRARGEESGRNGGAALNEAVIELRRSESAMCQMPGPSGSQSRAGSSAQRLGELGQRQSQLNQETRSLAQRLSQQMRLSAGDRQQLERYAQEQRRLRDQLEQIQKDDESRREILGRLDAARRDMKEVEEKLVEGATGGELEEQQNRILSRLLDATRSVNRRDFDPQRESRSGQDVVRASAPELPRELLRENDRLRLDLLKAEADRYPAQYRAFIEAYLKRLNGSRR